MCQVSAELLLLLVTRQGWTLSHGRDRRWSNYISSNTTKREEKPQAVPSRPESYCFYKDLSNKIAANCDNEKVFITPGGLWRNGWDETIRTGALEFCLAVIKGGE